MAVEQHQLLSSFGYQAKEGTDTVVITSRPPFFFFVILGIVIPFIAFMAYVGSADFLILLIPILALPFIHDSWKFPSNINFDSKKKLLSLRSPLFVKANFAYDDIKNVSVSTTSQSAGVSPFEEGNKDIIYRVYIELGGNRAIRLLKLKSRKEMSEDIKKITEYILYRMRPSDAISTK